MKKMGFVRRGMEKLYDKFYGSLLPKIEIRCQYSECNQGGVILKGERMTYDSGFKRVVHVGECTEATKSKLLYLSFEKVGEFREIGRSDAIELVLRGELSQNHLIAPLEELLRRL